VLLTYPDLAHLGAIPYAVGKLGLNCPIYATIPTFQMGQMFLYDAFQARYNQEDFDLFTVDDIDLAFEKFSQLKYQQKVYLEAKGEGIELLPLNAGHMIGGTFWRIKKETEEILYAVDYNHRKERYFPPIPRY
jgi:cleavage and polyadenylation specificity factor subunit 2